MRPSIPLTDTGKSQPSQFKNLEPIVRELINELFKIEN